MDEFTHRQVEAIMGLYSHPDVAKFIYTVLTNFETPVLEKYLKKNVETSPFMQKCMGGEQSFTPSWQNKTLTPPPLTRAHAISFLPGYQTMDVTPGSFVIPGQQPVATTTAPSPFVFPVQQNSFVGGQQPSGFLLPAQSDLKKQDEQIFVFTKDMIDKKSEITFKCSIAYNDISNKKIFISKKFKGNDVILPENYMWKNDDEFIFNSYILPLFKLGTADKKTLYENHLFLCCFEDLLKNVLVPSINQSEDGMERIVEAITIPVLLAFENELMNSKYRLNLFLMKKYSMDANSFKYLNLNDSSILERLENKSADVKGNISILIDKLNLLFSFSFTLSKNE
jgi:hypothetical protein